MQWPLQGSCLGNSIWKPCATQTMDPFSAKPTKSKEMQGIMSRDWFKGSQCWQPTTFWDSTLYFLFGINPDKSFLCLDIATKQYRFKFKVLLLLDWLPVKSRVFSLHCYLTHDWKKTDSCLLKGHLYTMNKTDFTYTIYIETIVLICVLGLLQNLNSACKFRFSHQ